MGAAPSTLTHVLGMNSPEGIRAYNNEARQIVPVDAPTVCAATARGTIATDVARVAAGGKPGAGTLKQSQDWGRPGVPLTVGDGDETWVHQLPPRMAENLFAATTTLPTGDGLPEYAALRTQASVQTIVSVLKGKAPMVGGQPLRDGQILFMAETFIHRRWAAHIWALADNEPDGELADNLRYQALTADQVQLVAEPGAGKTAAALTSLRPALSHGAVTGTESDDVGAALVLTSSSAAPVWELENARVTVGDSPALNFAGIINTLDQPLISSGYQLNVMTLGALKLIAQGYGNLDKTLLSPSLSFTPSKINKKNKKKNAYVSAPSIAPPPFTSSMSLKSTAARSAAVASPAFAFHASTARRSRTISADAASFTTAFLMVRTRCAYCSELADSSRLYALGATLTNINAFALPPMQSDRSRVSLWLR